MEDSPKSQVIERLKEAQNVLVTVSTNPSVDQLSAALGLTLMMNKLGKHATAVFSGNIPSTIEFLKPEDTLEQNTDSLRDFIISLDKSKADKLRYKVEENVVKIFITPYKTSLSENDLDFSQGDFNVDVVIALGVDQREHIDQAIMAHGRILHDATVIGVMVGDLATEVGSINWQDQAASSLCEMVTGLAEAFKPGIIDAQMATALLTGIVAETDRFSNQKTSPKVMTMSAQLMAAGANQQLIATELMPEEEVIDDLPEPQPEDEPPSEPQNNVPENPNEGVIELHEQPEEETEPEKEPELPKEPEIPEDQIHIDDQGTLKTARELAEAVENVRQQSQDAKIKGKTIQPPEQQQDNSANNSQEYSKYIETPPQNYQPFTGAAAPEDKDPSTDPLSAIPSSGPLPPSGSSVQSSPLLAVGDDAESVQASSVTSTESPLLASDGESDKNKPLGPDVKEGDTLADIEQSVEKFENDDTDAARQAVQQAMQNGDGFDPNRPKPLESLGAQEFKPEESPPAVPPPLIPPFPIPDEENKKE